MAEGGAHVGALDAMNDAGWRCLLAASAAPLGVCDCSERCCSPAQTLPSFSHAPVSLHAAHLFSAVLLLVFAPFLPESPRYLLAKGRTAEAQAVVQLMARVNGLLPLLRGKLRPSRVAPRNGSDDGEASLLHAHGAAQSSSSSSFSLAARPAAPGMAKGAVQRLRLLLHDMGHGARQLSAPQLRRTTGLLMVCWLCAAFRQVPDRPLNGLRDCA